MKEPLRVEDGFAEFIQLRQIGLFERIDLENAFQEPVLASPRPVDAQVLALILAALIKHERMPLGHGGGPDPWPTMLQPETPPGRQKTLHL